MKVKNILMLVIFVPMAVSCGGEDEKTAYRCTISNSDALFAADRANDLKQCWNGKHEKSSKALSWCGQKVSGYIASQYTFGHTVEYQVDKGGC